MKKLLSTLMCATILTTGAAMASDNTQQNCPPPPPEHQGQGQFHKKPPCPKMIEDQLNLTEEQKAAARKNRMEGRKEMKPIMDKIRDKHEAMLDVMDSDLSDAEKEKKIKVIKADMKKLKAQADAVREKNMKKFEAILTAEQKTKFEQIKSDMKKNRPHPPMKPMGEPFKK